MSQLARTVAVGPRARNGALPDHVDAFGQLSLDTPGKWMFTAVSPPSRAEKPRPRPTWRLRRGFGITEAGLIQVGIALALADVQGASEVGRRIIARRRLTPEIDVLVSPDVVEACRALHELPLALVLTSSEPCQETATALTVTTGWSVSTALIARD